MSHEEAATEIVRRRSGMFKSIEQSLIIESNYGWYGLLPVLNKVFPDFKVAIVVRDPRTWVQSNLNWQRMYGSKNRWPSFISNRLNPQVIGDNEHIKEWSGYTDFQKLCWTWKALHFMFLTESEKDNNIRLFKYEDLLQNKENTSEFDNFLTHITDFKEKKYQFKYSKSIFSTRINTSKNNQYPTLRRMA